MHNFQALMRILCMSTFLSGSSGMSSILSSTELQFESWLDDNGVDTVLLVCTVRDKFMFFSFLNLLMEGIFNWVTSSKQMNQITQHFTLGWKNKLGWDQIENTPHLYTFNRFKSDSSQVKNSRIDVYFMHSAQLSKFF